MSSNDLDVERDKLLSAIGEAIAQWSRLEHQFSHAFAYCMKADPFVAIPVFFAPSSFGAKLTLLEKAIQFGIKKWKHEEEYVQKAKLYKTSIKTAKRYSDIRNSIAHHRVEVEWKGSAPYRGIVFPNTMTEAFDNRILTTDAIRKSAQRFRTLYLILMEALFEHDPIEIEIIREQVLALPHRADGD